MKVILTQDVPKVGKRFDVKEVSSGYALNLLIPQGRAITATADALKRVEIEKKKADGERMVQEELLAKNIKDLESVTLTVTGKANAKGNLFAGLHTEEIAAELQKQAGLSVSPSFIQIEHPIKEVGEHAIEVKAGDKSATFKLVIQAK